jgi:site-specific DNA recombinase
MPKSSRSGASAAVYLRSSKDRHDVSIDAQRRELTDLARERGLVLVAEFADAVESGKDENRPGLQALLQSLKDPQRPWTHLLMVDTSRLSRQPYFAHAFSHDCERRGVVVIYSKVPDVDPISAVILHSVLRAMDRVHSLMSREKGLAGMAENVRRGYRAGGRAPLGYRLERIATGTQRDGHSVTKTRLEPTAEGSQVATYLEARARGLTQPQAASQAGLEHVSQSTLIGCEWRALTYAGHTVWNQHAERIDGQYKGGRKHRPREEWVINRDTHPALITDATAEAILARLLHGSHGERTRAGKVGASDYLLTGLLEAPDGRRWIGDKGVHYRLRAHEGHKGRAIPCAELDEAILIAVRADLEDPKHIRGMLREVAKAQSSQAGDPAAELRAELTQINRQLDRLVDLALDAEEPAPYHRKTQALEADRRRLAAAITSIEREHAQQVAAGHITEDQLQRLLRDVLENLDGAGLKHALQEMVDRIVLDPATGECQIRYAIGERDRLRVASPRRCDGWPVLRWQSRTRVGRL